MPPRPLVLRLIFPFTVMILLVIGICGAVVYWAGQQHVRLQQIHDLDRLVALVRQRLPGEGTALTADESARVRDLATVLDTRITLIDGSGAVFFDTYHDPRTMDNHNSRTEVAGARARGVGSSVRRSDTINENAVYVAQRLDPGKPEGVIVRLSYPERVWTRLGVPVWAIVLAGTASAALLMLCLAWVLQRQWIGPVRELAAAADRMAAGDWKTRVEPDGADAVRALGGRFNVMAAQTQKQVAELDHRRADLQSLVDSLPDPVLLSDALERVVVINAPAARLLHLTPAQALGKKITVIVNEEAILHVLDQVKAKTPITREIRLSRGGQRVTYQAVATSAKTGGVLLVLRNVSAMAQAVQMKTDFVANASHELRTPIAAIKAAFETFQEAYRDDPAQTARCVTIIEGHLSRLEEMLSDLLDLSRVESSDLKAQISPVRIADLQSAVHSTMGPLATQKGIALQFDAGEWGDEIDFNSDRHLLDLVLKNLVENSLKFTPAGGAVTIRLVRQSGAVVLEVIDTGIGIPPEHQERVFERFYQVDAARSGSPGRGTGLGLAIVKHTVHALGGTVTLSSEVGRGTTVACVMPLLGMIDEPVKLQSASSV